MMMNFLKKLPVVVLLFLVQPLMAQKVITLKSPDGNLLFTLTQTNEKPLYKVSYRGKTLIANSGLGLTFKDGGSFGADLQQFKPVFNTVDERYELVVGKTKNVRSNYQQMIVPMIEHKGGKTINL